MKPTGPFFIFSSLYFLNNLQDNDPIFSLMNDVLHNVINMPKEKEIAEQYHYDLKQAKMIKDYMETMQDFQRKIKHIEEFKGEQQPLEFYIKTVKNCVREHLSERGSSEIFKLADTYLDEALENCSKQTRSSIQKYLTDMSDNVPEAVRFARAILDISYNYQVERSIKDITITHDLSNSRKVSETVYEYYNEHDFEVADRQCSLPVHHKIWHWNALSQFCKGLSARDVESKYTWNRHLLSVIWKKISTSVLVLILIAAILFSSSVTDALYPFLVTSGWINIVAVLITALTYILLEAVNYCFPTSIINGGISIWNNIRMIMTYKKYKKGRCYYIFSSLREYIIARKERK